jgi:hypothetical protein
MGSNSKSKKAEVARAALFITGLEKHFASGSPLTFASAAHIPSDLVKSFQALIDLRGAVNAARSALQAKLGAEASGAPAIFILMDDFEAFVKLTFKAEPEVLVDFGLAPRKARKPLTAAQQAAANAKAAATRKARGTVGPVKKKAVKGNVEGVTITATTSITEPASPAAPSAPAPAGGAAGGTVSKSGG